MVPRVVVTKASRSEESHAQMAEVAEVAHLSTPEPLTISHGSRSVAIPEDYLPLFQAFTAALRDGHGFAFLPEDAGPAPLLSSQETADLLNVSRPFVVKLAKKGQLPHTKVGNRHRFTLRDVLEYKQHLKAEGAEALAAMVPAGGYRADDF
jgi:excisionase family DNA binding protein